MDPELVALRQVLGLAAGVTVDLPAEPADYQRRLLETLGARWRVVRTTTTEKERHADGTLTMSELNRRHQATLDAQPLRVSCQLRDCGWSHTGPAGMARELAAQHRQEAHPGLGRAPARRAAQDREEAEARAEQLRQQHALAAMDAGEPQPTSWRAEPMLADEPDEISEDSGATKGPIPLKAGRQPDAPEETGPAPDVAAEPEADPPPAGTGGASTTIDPFEQRRRRRKAYTRDEILTAFRRFHDEHGRGPLPSDVKTCAYLPSPWSPTTPTARVSGFANAQAVWDELGWGKLPTGQAARKYRGLAAVTPHTRNGGAPAQTARAAHDREAPPAPEPPVADPAAHSDMQELHEPPTLAEGVLQLLDAVRGGLDALNAIVDAAERALNEHAGGGGPIRIRIGGAP